MISDLRARQIASEWHGGGGTALYALSSTGAILSWEARTHCEEDSTMNLAVSEISQELRELQQATYSERRALTALLAYVERNGIRGPVAEWSDLTW